MQRFPNILTIVFGLTLGGVLMALSVPRTMAAFTLLPVETILQKVIAGDDVAADDLLRLREAQQTSLDWAWSSTVSADMAHTEIALAKVSGRAEDRSDWYDQAAHTVEDGLLKAPSNPYSWTRLANLRLRNAEKGQGVSEPLLLSLLSGPYERSLVLPRLNYALRIWDQLSEEQRMSIQGQILIADRIDRGQLVKLAMGHQKNMKIIVSAMAGDLNRFKGFIKALNK